ncbi:hypothetical protein JVU11DRAFT_10766 [Chiua virens]|nr:hypothetical protein JVU11DRAFT_10766 [Chiua virens]
MGTVFDTHRKTHTHGMGIWWNPPCRGVVSFGYQLCCHSTASCAYPPSEALPPPTVNPPLIISHPKTIPPISTTPASTSATLSPAIAMPPAPAPAPIPPSIQLQHPLGHLKPTLVTKTSCKTVDKDMMDLFDRRRRIRPLPTVPTVVPDDQDITAFPSVNLVAAEEGRLQPPSSMSNPTEHIVSPMVVTIFASVPLPNDTPVAPGVPQTGGHGNYSGNTAQLVGSWYGPRGPDPRFSGYHNTFYNNYPPHWGPYGKPHTFPMGDLQHLGAFNGNIPYKAVGRYHGGHSGIPPPAQTPPAQNMIEGEKGPQHSERGH